MCNMIYLGIDVAKSTHVAVAMTADGEVILTPFSFSNSSAGFALLLEKLKCLPDMPLVIGLKSTAHYGEKSNLFSLYKRISRCDD